MKPPAVWGDAGGSSTVRNHCLGASADAHQRTHDLAVSSLRRLRGDGMIVRAKRPDRGFTILDNAVLPDWHMELHHEPGS